MTIFEKGKYELQLNYRLPIEFHWLGTGWIKACLIWLAYGWITSVTEIWTNYGFRIFGIEFNLKKERR